MTSSDDGIDGLTDTLRAWARNHRDDGAELTLPRTGVCTILDELSRLVQSNARLRKQNRRLRQRLALLKGEDEPTGGGLETADGP